MSLAAFGFKKVPDRIFQAQRTLNFFRAEQIAAEETGRVSAARKKKQDELAADLAQWEVEHGHEPIVIDDDDDDSDGPHGIVVSGTDEGAEKKTYRKRPDNWKAIGHYGAQYGLSKAVDIFRHVFPKNMVHSAVKSAVNRYIKDFRSGKKEGRRPTRMSVIGEKEEGALIAAFWERSRAGLPLLDNDLRFILVGILSASGKINILKEHGGKHSFRGSWFSRFYRRHGISLRAATSKMREKPADFDAKVAAYEDVLASLLAAHSHLQLHPSLVVGVDETNTLFVPRGNKTRAMKGSKRVRTHGVGKEKPQVTVSIAVNREGRAIDTQIIFGGKTNRCHPKKLPPANTYYAHTESHWQTPASALEYVNKKLGPYRKEEIRRINEGLPESDKLPNNAKALLIWDLHYSHFDESVLKALSDNDFLVCFVPAGCTDEMQVLDTAVNKPYKNGVKNGFRRYLSNEYDIHIAAGFPPNSFNPILTVGTMKEQLPAFVEAGLASIQTDVMKQSIRDAWDRDARFANVLKPERLQLAAEKNREAKEVATMMANDTVIQPARHVVQWMMLHPEERPVPLLLEAIIRPEGEEIIAEDREAVRDADFGAPPSARRRGKKRGRPRGKKDGKQVTGPRGRPKKARSAATKPKVREIVEPSDHDDDDDDDDDDEDDNEDDNDDDEEDEEEEEEEEEDDDTAAAKGEDGIEEGDLHFELEDMLPLDDITPLVNTEDSDDAERPSNIVVGHRVKWRVGRTTAASDSMPGLTKAAPGNAGANILNEAIHGIVRAIVGRNVKVQWFSTTVPNQLHTHPPALIYVLFPDEFSIDIERHFTQIHN